jgi:tetratricopeptide (TPR) repeat protein
VKRALVLTGLLAIGAVTGALAYRSAARDRSYRVLIASGEAALAADETLAAVEDFSGAIAVRPDAMLARLRRGETYRKRGELEVAARDFRAAATLDPTATRPLEALGDVLFAQARFKRAAETYEARLKLDERSARVRYKLSLARYREGAIDAALGEAQRAIALDPQLADAYYLSAMCLRDKGKLADAVEPLQQALQRVPAMVPAREELADLLGALNRHREQIEQLRLLASSDTRNVERRVALALAEARQGEPDAAVATLSAALEQASDPSAVHTALGRVWLEVAATNRDRPEALSRALESLERGASSFTATSETKALYGRALVLAGQLDAAEQLFAQAIERFPVDPTAFRDLALVAERLGHTDRARTALIQYASLVTDDATAAQQALRIGSLSMKLNDATGALPWLQRALASRPDDIETLTLIADAQLRTGDIVGARASTLRVLMLEPDNRQAKALSARLRKTAIVNR